MYNWRRMTHDERARLMRYRQQQELPWHSPPHRKSFAPSSWMLSASCYEHQPHIGHTTERLVSFEEALLDTFEKASCKILAWVLLPNHYHALVCVDQVRQVLTALGRLHGRTSYLWNGEEATRGRKVWFNAAETVMKSDGHYWASLNYIHANPVKHGYARNLLDWPFSSVHEWTRKAGREWIEHIAQKYPIDEYGKGWDD